jgi:hypothetical protein
MVLLAFLDYDRSADGADLFPSLRRIADYTGCSYRSVRRAKDALEEMGVLEVVGHVSSRYELRGHVAKYRFHPERLPTGPSRPRRRQRLAARSVSRDNRTPCPLVEPSTMGHAVTTRGQLDADKRTPWPPIVRTIVLIVLIEEHRALRTRDSLRARKTTTTKDSRR